MISHHHEIRVIGSSLFFGGLLIVDAFRRWFRLRLVEDTPRSKIATTAQGWTEIQGFAWTRHDQCLKDSAGFDVVYQKFELQQQQSGWMIDRRNTWVTVFETGLQEPFHVLDGTGLAIVSPETAILELGPAKMKRWSSLSEAEKSAVLGLMGDQRVDHFPPDESWTALFEKKFRIQESEITVGSPICVIGNFQASNSKDRFYHEQGLSQFYQRVINSQTREAKDLSHLFDQNHDGKVSGAEAKYGYSLAAKLARLSNSHEDSNSPGFEVFGTLSSADDRKMVLAALHRQQLRTQLGFMLLPQFVCGAALVAFAVFH